MKFTSQQFVATAHSSADDKAAFANQFVKFVTNGFKRSDFTKKFYNRISMCRGHIAHYNQDGFYEEWFSTPESKKEFINHWINFPIYGDPRYTYSDVEASLKAWILNEINYKEQIK